MVEDVSHLPQVPVSLLFHTCHRSLLSFSFPHLKIKQIKKHEVKDNELCFFSGARVIVDLSWPHVSNPDPTGATPISINDGIRSEDFPTRMTSIEEVLLLINKCGTEGWLVKQDWADGMFKYICFPH